MIVYLICLATLTKKAKLRGNKREKKERKKEIRLDHKKKNENYISKNEKKKLRVIQEDSQDIDNKYFVTEEQDFEDKEMTLPLANINKKSSSFGYEFTSQNSSSSK